MEGAPLNESDHCGDPPLLLAAGNGHKAVCELLIEEGADVEQRNVMGESPLIRYGACCVTRRASKCALLFAFVVDGVCLLDLLGGGGYSWIPRVWRCVRREWLTCSRVYENFRAAHNGHLHTVKYLVEQAKADVNAIDMGDNSALHWAAMRGHVEIVKFLMDQVCCCVVGCGAGGERRQRSRAPSSSAVMLNLNFSFYSIRTRRGAHTHVPVLRMQQGADKSLRNKQDKMAIDLCQPCWSDAYRFTREVLA
jgi:ankyrin repeat protein